MNTPIHSVSTGVLAFNGEDGWVKHVGIRSGNFYYLYAHLNENSPL